MKNFRSLLGVVLLFAMATFASGQTALTSTTLSSAVTDSTKQIIVVASATGFTAGNVAFVDREAMIVLSANGTTISVQRGMIGTRGTPHLTSATVLVGLPKYFINYDRSGACTRGNEVVLPQVNLVNGRKFDCFGGQWYTDGGIGIGSYAISVAPGAQPSAASPAVGNPISLVSQAGGAQSATTGNGAVGGANSQAGGAGGAGGSSSGTGGAGGAISQTGGAGGGTITGGVGGASSIVGGAGGAGSTTAGAGGAVNVTGGAAPSTAGTSAVGGVASLTGGAGSANTASGGTAGAGAAANITGGAGGAASTGAATGGAGGALALAGGAGGGTITGGAGGAISLTGGAGANGSTAGGSGGNVTLRGGNVGTGGTGVVGKVQIAGAVDATKLLIFDPSGATTGTATTFNFSQSAARTLTAPDSTGGLPVVISCGSTGTGNQTCSPAAATVKTQIVNGTSTLSSNAAVITFATAFTSTTSYFCVANDITTRANPVQMLSTSAGTATITNTTGASDVIQWICVGN